MPTGGVVSAFTKMFTGQQCFGTIKRKFPVKTT